MEVADPVTTAHEPETAVSPQAVHENAEPAARTQRQLFHYASWVHVGPGADECDGVDEEAGTVTCSDAKHFHAWLRLPNQFQHKDIRDKALAAKARQTRMLRDPETDAYAIMEDELDRLARAGEEIKESLVEELAEKDWYDDTLTAQRELLEEDGEDGTKPWEHIEDDQRRLAELQMMPEDERPAEEFTTLAKHVVAYDAALTAKIEELGAPLRQSLRQLDLNQLIDRIRDDRVELRAHEAFTEVYNKWEWFTCTLKAPGGERVWPSAEAMEQAAPEVIAEVQLTFRDLEVSNQRGFSDSGN